MLRTLPLLAITLAAPAICAAQDESDPLAKFSFSLRSRGVFAAETDLDGGGTVSVVRAGPTLSARYADSQTWFVNLSLGAEFSFYDFEGATGIVAGGDPAGDFAAYTVSARFTSQANDDWWWFVDGRATWSGEDGDNLGDGFTGRGTLGATYILSDTLTIGLGVAVRSRLEDDAVVYPLPIINWKINDRWTLATADNGLRVSFAALDELTLFAAAGWESREFRLSDSGPIPGGSCATTASRWLPVRSGAPTSTSSSKPPSVLPRGTSTSS
jgi:hypothetical protein